MENAPTQQTTTTLTCGSKLRPGRAAKVLSVRRGQGGRASLQRPERVLSAGTGLYYVLDGLYNVRMLVSSDSSYSPIQEQTFYDAYGWTDVSGTIQ